MNTECGLVCNGWIGQTMSRRTDVISGATSSAAAAISSSLLSPPRLRTRGTQSHSQSGIGSRDQSKEGGELTGRRSFVM